MSKSLQDQLLALGFANEKAKKTRKPPVLATGKTQQRFGGGSSPKKGQSRVIQHKGGGLSLDRAYALRQQEEKKQVDTARKRKQAEDRRRRQLNTQIRAIVTKHRLNDTKAEVPRYFLYRGRIRKISLTPDQLIALNAGELGIAYLSGSYHLLPPERVESLRELSAEHIPDLTFGQTEKENKHPVPDDLTW